MMTRARLIVTGTALFLSGAAVGVLGSYKYWRSYATQQELSMRQAEVAGRMAVDIEILAEWRTGEEESARALLERFLDNAIVMLGSSRQINPWSKDVRGTLALAKTYRTAFPSVGPAASSVEKMLRPVPFPSREYCSAAMKKVAVLAEDEARKRGD